MSVDDGNLLLESARLATMKELVEAGHIRSGMDTCHALEEVAAAHRCVGQGHRREGVAITGGHVVAA